MSLYNILDNNNLNYSDKISQICKILPQDLLVSWSCDCAESVLHVYENIYPNDLRPRNAILATRSGDKSAAHAAARAAARAAAYAARTAAYAAADAAYAAVNAAAYAAADAAVNAINAAANEKEQEKLNLQLLRKQVEIYESPLYQAMRE